MAETPFSPESPASPPPAEEAPQEASEAPAPVDALTQALAEALDEDDLPEPQHGSSPPAAAAVARPEPAPAPAPPAPTVAAAAAVDEPSIAASLEVPPLPAGSAPADGESGGEWELLTAKVRQWIGDGEPQKLLNRIGGPLKAVAYLLGLLLVLRVYRSVVGTIDGIPLVSGLLELVGLIALVRFCLLRLVRRSEREEVLGNLQKRWDDFRGKV
jgi:hypothetical protein